MIKKVIEMKKGIDAQDIVELSWFDMQKPNLSAVTKEGIEFMVKVKFTHLHENDVLVCEDGYTIQVQRCEDTVYELRFKDPFSFAKIAYEIGNRHQPIYLEEYKITILDDISLNDIVDSCKKNSSIEVKKTEGYFKPNGKAHHSH